MRTIKINATIIALLSTTVFLVGCSDEKKEVTKKKTEQFITESKPTELLSGGIDSVKKIADNSAQTINKLNEKIVEKTAETTQGLRTTVEATAINAVAAVTDSSAVKMLSNSAIDLTAVVDTSPKQMREIQQALLESGFNPGPVDGVIGPKTMAALKSFQKQNNLTVGNVSIETLQALGVAE